MKKYFTFFKKKKNDVQIPQDGTVKAVCVKTFDAWHNTEEERLVKGQSYTVEYAVIARSFTSIYLKELQGWLTAHT